MLNNIPITDILTKIRYLEHIGSPHLNPPHVFDFKEGSIYKIRDKNDSWILVYISRITSMGDAHYFSLAMNPASMAIPYDEEDASVKVIGNLFHFIIEEIRRSDLPLFIGYFCTSFFEKLLKGEEI